MLTPPANALSVVFMPKTKRDGFPIGPVWFVVPDGDEFLHLPATDGRYWFRTAAEKLARLYAIEFEETSP